MHQRFVINLVDLVKKRPCLWNSRLADYSKRDVTEEAWKQVSKEVQRSVATCKEKWRNIRASYVRYIRPGTKPKKPYYLSSKLEFLLPYVKLNYSFDDMENLPTGMTSPSSESSVEFEYVECDKVEDTDNCDSTPNKTTEEETESPRKENSLKSESNQYQSTANGTAQVKKESSSMRKIRKRKRAEEEDDETYSPTSSRSRTKNNEDKFDSQSFTAEKRGRKKKRVSEKSVVEVYKNLEHEVEEEDCKKLFLLSLLPELRQMNNAQMRQFKRSVLILIDEVLGQG